MWTWTPLPIWMRQWSDRGSKEIPSLYIYIPRTHVTHVICLGGWTFHLMGRILQKTDHFASRYIFLLYIFYIPEHAKPSLSAIGKRSLGPSHWWKKHCTSWRMMVLPLSHVLRKFWYVHGGLPNFWTINSMPTSNGWCLEQHVHTFPFFGLEMICSEPNHIQRCPKRRWEHEGTSKLH